MHGLVRFAECAQPCELTQTKQARTNQIALGDEGNLVTTHSCCSLCSDSDNLVRLPPLLALLVISLASVAVVVLLRGSRRLCEDGLSDTST